MKTFAPPSSLRALTAAEASAAIALVENQCNSKLDPQVRAALMREFSRPGQRWIDPSLPLASVTKSGVPSESVKSQIGQDGVLHVYFDRVYGAGNSEQDDLSVDPLGELHGGVSTSAVITYVVLSAPPYSERELYIPGILEIAISVLLLATGTAALRNSTRWRLLHCLWAVAQLTCAVVIFIPLSHVYSAHVSGIYLAYVLLPGALCLYAAVLLVLLAGRSELGPAPDLL